MTDVCPEKTLIHICKQNHFKSSQKQFYVSDVFEHINHHCKVVYVFSTLVLLIYNSLTCTINTISLKSCRNGKVERIKDSKSVKELNVNHFFQILPLSIVNFLTCACCIAISFKSFITHTVVVFRTMSIFITLCIILTINYKKSFTYSWDKRTSLLAMIASLTD